MTDLGPQRGWMDVTSFDGCGFNVSPSCSPEGDCRKPAVIHVRLPTADEGFISGCAEHKRIALLMPHRDHHVWRGECGMPGTLWHDSPTPDEADSYCAVDDSGEEPCLIRHGELVRSHG